MQLTATGSGPRSEPRHGPARLSRRRLRGVSLAPATSTWLAVSMAILAVILAVFEGPSRGDPDRPIVDDGADGTAHGRSASRLSTRASTEVSAYTDSDSVHVLSPMVAGSVGDETAGWSVGGSYMVDAVSAASVDIVTTASGHWVETRQVGAGSADFKVAGAAVSLAGGFSREPDYLSVGGGGLISVELDDKNVVPFIGGSYGHDRVGRHGDPMSIWPTTDKLSLKTGATFVVGRSTIAAVSLDAIFDTGYMAKPYRYLPVVAPGAAASIPAGASVGLVKSVNLFSVAENVPTERSRLALSGRLAHRWSGSTLRVDQRLYADNWGLLATTTDLHEYLDLGSHLMVWPHVRVHAQRGVDFWRRVVEQIPNPGGGPAGIPTYRAGDRELGPLDTVTGGLGIRVLLRDDARAPWAASWQIDGSFTRYLDAVYISQRRSLFSAFSLEAGF